MSDYKIRPGKSSTKILLPKISRLCRDVYKECRSLKFEKALIETKCGFLDLTQVCPESNCLLISVAFGLYLQKSNFEMKKCLRHFLSTKRHQSNLFIAEHLFPLSVAKMSEQHLWDTLEIISSFKKVDFHLYSFSFKNHAIYKIWQTKNFPNEIPLYLLLKDEKNQPHIEIIFDLNLINNNKKGMVCYLCANHFTYSWFKYHKCKFKRCTNCNGFLNIDCGFLPQSSLCRKSDNDSNGPKKCNDCLKTFDHSNCFEYHKKRGACKQNTLCKFCGKFICLTVQHKHKCFGKFCLRCYSYHRHDQNFCNLRTSKVNDKTFEKIIYLDIKTKLAPNSSVALLSDIDKSNMKYLNIELISYNCIGQYDSLEMKHFLTFKRHFNGCENSIEVQIRNILETKYKAQRTCILSTNNAYNCMAAYFEANSDKFIGSLSSNVFKCGNIYFKRIENFIDFNDLELAFYMQLNPNNFFLCDKFNEYNNDTYKYCNEDFCCEDTSLGDNLALYDFIMNKKNETKQKFDGKKINDIFFCILLNIHWLRTIALKKVATIFKLCEEANTNDYYLFQFNSLTSAGYRLYTNALSKIEMCNLPNKNKSILTSTSKNELILCKIFSKVHSNLCEGKIMSKVTNDGRQFQFKSLSLDFLCVKCKLGIAVEGDYKTNCLFHPKVEVSFFDKKSIQLFETSQNNRLRLLTLAKAHVNKIIVINECCAKDRNSKILAHTLSVLGKGPHKKKHLEELDEEIVFFNRDYYEDLHFQDSILGNYVSPIALFVNHDQKYCTQKYDLKNAFLSKMIDADFPLGEPKRLVGKEAELFFQSQIIPNKLYAVVKAKVCAPQNILVSKLPFLPVKIKTKSGGKSTYLGMCKTCCQNGAKSKCNHTVVDRTFLTTCLREDIEYALSLGYTFNILVVYYWKQKSGCSDISSICKNAMALMNRNINEKIERKFLKQMMLSALGRFALDVEKYDKVLYCYSKTHFFLELAQERNTSYNVSERMARFEQKGKSFDYQHHYKNAVRCNINPLIFATVSNACRREVHTKAMQCLSTNMFLLCRIDTDSILCTFSKSMESVATNLFPKCQYKLEEENVTSYLSRKKRSYMYYRANNGTVCVKTCGLQMSLAKRTTVNMPSDCDFEVSDRVTLQMCEIDGLAFIDSIGVGF